MKSRLATVIAMFAICVPAAFAQSTPHASREAVMKFFTATHIEQQVGQVQSLMADEMGKSLRASLENDPTLSAAERERVMQLIAPEVRNAPEVYPVSEMLQDMVPVYQKHFTDSDMQAITAFFESPVGKKFITENGPMMQEAMQVIMPKMNTRMQARMAEMQQRIVERLKQKPAEKKQ